MLAFLLSKEGLYVIGGIGMFLLVLRAARFLINIGREKEKAKRLKEEANADKKYKGHFNAGVNMPGVELDKRLQNLHNKK